MSPRVEKPGGERRDVEDQESRLRKCNGFKDASQRVERAQKQTGERRQSRPGTLTPPRWSGDRHSVRASERSLQDAGFVIDDFAEVA